MVFENGEELSEDRTPILDERDSVSYEEFGGDQVIRKLLVLPDIFRCFRIM